MNGPILVTGAHRSGTTWVGKMLATDPQVTYISEPLNVLHRPGVMQVPTTQWYTYICNENEDRYQSALRELLRFQYHPWLEVKSLRTLKDFIRMWRDGGTFLKGRLFSRLPLIKDPFAVFSTEWFANNLDCDVVIVVRHPAAVASSLVRLGWKFNFSDLLNQPLLMRDWLEPFRGDMEAIDGSNQDVIYQSSLLWRMIYQVVDNLRTRHPEFIVIRHEDVSLDPLDQFEQLFQDLDLDFSQSVKQQIINSSNARNPKEVSRQKVHSVRVDSRANIENWKQRLTHSDIDRVRDLTGDVASLFYSEDDWHYTARAISH